LRGEKTECIALEEDRGLEDEKSWKKGGRRFLHCYLKSGNTNLGEMPEPNGRMAIRKREMWGKGGQGSIRRGFYSLVARRVRRRCFRGGKNSNRKKKKGNWQERRRGRITFFGEESLGVGIKSRLAGALTEQRRLSSVRNKGA